MASMARTFADLSDKELGALVRARYARLDAAHQAGFGDCPNDTWARDTLTLKQYREAAASGGVSGKEPGSADSEANEMPDNPVQTGEDDDQPEESEPGNAGAEPAQDSAEMSEDDLIRISGHRDVEGELWAARGRRTNAKRTARMASVVSGYDRLK